MKWMRGFWAGAILALVLSGCSDDSGDNKVQGGGVYSPIITGLAVAPSEPAVRGMNNELTVQVTNVNGYPITYHWTAASGTLLSSTSQTVTWTAPDSVGFVPVTVSIEASDPGGAHFFKTTTFQVLVDNQYTRWTHSPEIQFDPAPAPLTDGGLLFAEYSNIAAGRSDVYYLAGPGLSPEIRTDGFYSANSPSMRSDGLQIAFAGRGADTDSQEIWVAPGGGGAPDDPGVERIARISQFVILGVPRFSRDENWVMYASDSTSASAPRPWFRDAEAFPFTAPERVIDQVSLASRTFWGANWGPDVNLDGLPDSIVVQGFRFFRASNQRSQGLYKFATRPPEPAANQWLADSSATEPDWSADGQYIVFADPNFAGDRDIWIIRADTNDRTKAIRVTNGTADDSHPRFSEDGNTIYFVSNRADRYGLYGVYPTERRGTNIWSVTRFDRP